MSEQKIKLVEELENLFGKLDTVKLYVEPGHKTTKDWLANVAGVLKNLDEGDYQEFMNLRKYIYRSVHDREARKDHAEQIDNFVRQKVAEYKRHNFDVQKQTVMYINQEILESFIKKHDSFNYKKLIKILGELNYNFAAGYQYASSMLIRAVLDHIPPIFGYTSFEEVVNNYSWDKTDKEYMKKLLDFKNNADDALHRQISEDQDLLEMDNLPNSNRINRLLQECLKIGGNIKPQKEKITKQQAKVGNIQISLADENISWANYGVYNYVWSSFRISLHIDNYKSNKPDYVSISVKAKTADGNEWVAKHFIYEKVDKQDLEFRIEANEVKTVTAFVSDYKADNQTRKPMPELDKKTLTIEIETKSGEHLTIPISEVRIIKG
jgi:hypothetical protein